MAIALGSVFIWLLIAAAISALALAFKVVLGIVGLGLRLVWLVVVLPIVILAAVFTGPLLLAGLIVLAFCVLARACRR